MTQREFEARVKMEISSKEYDAIEIVYMNSDLEKDDFCKVWAKMNKSRIDAYKKMKIEEERIQELKEKAFDLYNKLSSFDWMRLASAVMNEKEEILCDEIGIELREWSVYYQAFEARTVLSVRHELGKYCGAIA